MPDADFDKTIARRRLPEELEDRLLAPWAARSSESGGREFPEREHGYRTLFQRDRDRVVHSAAFRRLMDKTQVFALKESDYYRTRLTHTMEVAQIARTAARTLELNEDLAEAIALAHDLGHPPFGHVGEDVLREVMRDEGGFEHNWQGLRIVEKLEVRYPEFPGLNLTWETREGIMKYKPANRLLADARFGGAGKPTLEAQLVNVADEIAYSCHDVDDGLKSGIFNETALAEAEIGRRMEESLDASGLGPGMRRYRIVRQLVNYFVTDLIETSWNAIEASGVKSTADVRAWETNLIALSPPASRELAGLKRILMQSFYRHPRIADAAKEGARLLPLLFRSYMEKPEKLPENALQRVSAEGLKRVVCDYVAGMTDRYALDECRRLALEAP